MRYRKLRIAFSATCLIACVLLIALWVRSYWWFDLLMRHITTTCGVTVISARARIWFSAGGMREETQSELSSWPHDRLHDIESFAAGWGFGAYMHGPPNPVQIAVKAPHWFAILALAAVAATPWLRWRFSLRTLLIATTLIAVVLGLIVWAAR
jgi:hypothetical protein